MRFKDFFLNIKIKPKDFFLPAFLLLAAAFSFMFWLIKFPGGKAVFIYESADKKTLSVERRFYKGKPSVSKIQTYVDELLLGPVSERCKPIFAQGTKALSCFERGNVLYVNLSSDLLKADEKETDFRKQINLFEKNIRSNFPLIREINLFIDGNAPFEF